MLVVGTTPVIVVPAAFTAVYVEYKLAIAGIVAAYVTVIDPFANAVVPTDARPTVVVPRVVLAATPAASVKVYET
jgi:hypothetical protein